MYEHGKEVMRERLLHENRRTKRESAADQEYYW